MSGTCRMGKDAGGRRCGPAREWRRKLRIADARSCHARGRDDAPCAFIGERMAEILAAKA
jgi:hypothetical protein